MMIYIYILVLFIIYYYYLLLLLLILFSLLLLLILLLLLFIYYYYCLQVAVNSCELLSQARQHQHCPGFSEVDPTARPLQCHSNQRTSRDCDCPESSQLPKPCDGWMI